MLPHMPAWHVTRRSLHLLAPSNNDVYEPYGLSTKIEIERERERERESLQTAKDGLRMLKRTYKM